MLEMKDFFCRVTFVYIQDTTGDIERIRVQVTLYQHSLFLRLPSRGKIYVKSQAGRALK